MTLQNRYRKRCVVMMKAISVIIMLNYFDAVSAFSVHCFAPVSLSEKCNDSLKLRKATFSRAIKKRESVLFLLPDQAEELVTAANTIVYCDANATKEDDEDEEFENHHDDGFYFDGDDNGSGSSLSSASRNGKKSASGKKKGGLFSLLFSRIKP